MTLQETMGRKTMAQIPEEVPLWPVRPPEIYNSYGWRFMVLRRFWQVLDSFSWREGDVIDHNTKERAAGMSKRHSRFVFDINIFLGFFQYISDRNIIVCDQNIFQVAAVGFRQRKLVRKNVRLKSEKWKLFLAVLIINLITKQIISLVFFSQNAKIMIVQIIILAMMTVDRMHMRADTENGQKRKFYTERFKWGSEDYRTMIFLCGET